MHAQYCNGTLYNGDIDPHDKLRPCHLDALNRTAINYAQLVDKAAKVRNTRCVSHVY